MRLSQLTTDPKPIDNYHLVYRRPVTTKWQFVGYRCLNCDRVLKNDTTVPKHTLNCKKHVRVYKVEPEPIITLDKVGQPWQPFEMNQNPGTATILKNDK